MHFLKSKWRSLLSPMIKRGVESSIPCLVFLIRGAVSLLYATCRIETIGFERLKNMTQKRGCILLFWHNRIMLTPLMAKEYLQEISFKAVTGKGRDAEIVQQILNYFPNMKTLRGSSSTKGATLHEIIRSLTHHNDVIVITPDGPRGPKYSFKPGAAISAIKTGALVFLFTWEAKYTFKIPLTWDGMRLPMPFSRVVATISPPIEMAQETALNEAIHMLQTALNDLGKTEYDSISSPY